MIQAVQTTNPDLILHLGDGASDAARLHKHFPHIPLHTVRGNCDFGTKAPLVNGFAIEEKHTVMTHGHRYNVKSGYTDIVRMGRETGADILLFGHTHIPHYEQVDDMHVLNPGPASHSCALIEITDGKIICKHISI